METGNLRNEDFRKLLSQRRTEPAKAGEKTEHTKRGGGAAFSHKQAAKQQYKKKGGAGHKYKQKHHDQSKKKKKDDEGEGEEKEEDDDDDGDANLKEIMKNYRDRAAERRTKSDEPSMDPHLAAAYRAVPGDRRAVYDVAMKRQQAIEESKYLGGDMEHTHLVKGLDYSLLHKMRSEITKTRGDDDEYADEEDELEAALATRSKKRDKGEEVQEVEKQPESVMARNLQRLMFKSELPMRNDHFGKGRMAYVVDLDDETSDIPTTLLRSVHDCPVTETNATVNANNVLISKLTQVLSYLRADTKKKVAKVKETFGSEENRVKAAEASIFDDAGEYVPSREKKEREGKDRDREGGAATKKDYFADSDRREERDRERRRDERRERDGNRERRDDRDKERDERKKADDHERTEREMRKKLEEAKRLEEKLAKRKRDTEGYDECYPGGMEMMGFGDSDDEEEDGEPSKKKGRAAVWGEDIDKEKHAKTSNKTEVKAAYQFGIKKGDGRKTGKGQEKKLDQELGKISKLMEKRKTEGTSAPKINY